MGSLQNGKYFPTFRQLPLVDELDQTYYSEQQEGYVVPNRTWCFVGEIVCDEMSQLAVLGHRINVRDVEGGVHSVLFFPEDGELDVSQLRKGHTVFIRYAQRCCFSDLMTEAIKVEHLNFVQVINTNLDTLFYLSQLYFAQKGTCPACLRPSSAGPSAATCPGCGSAFYCCPSCQQQHQPHHLGFCTFCKELSNVLNIDFDRFVQFVPFRT